jgi:hypothetical protein
MEENKNFLFSIFFILSFFYPPNLQCENKLGAKGLERKPERKLERKRI